MIKKIRKNFVRTWFLISFLIAGALTLRFLFFSQQAPTLQDVLTYNKLGRTFDFSLFVAALLSLSLATLSVAKGYEIFKRNREVENVVLPEVLDLADNDEVRALNTRSEELRQKLEELKCDSDVIQQENSKLVGQLENIYTDIDDLKRIESMLRKSNIALGKECERLRSENEEFVSKVNSSRVKARRSAAKSKAKKTKKKIKSKTKK